MEEEYGATKRDSKLSTKAKCSRMLEGVILTLVILVISGIFAIPWFFFYIGPVVMQSNNSSTVDSSVCLEPAVYSGATCRAELQVYQECFSGSAGSNGDILIRSDINQETVEADAELLIESGLSFLNPSAECVAAIRPFLCLYLFGVCDSSSQLRQVSFSECVDLRDDICATVWSAAVGFLGDSVLPVCEELSVPQTRNCQNDSEVIFASNATTSAEAVVECRNDYYLNNESLCLPVCGNFTQEGVLIETSEAVVTILSCCIAVISALLVIILSFTVQRHFMLAFPSCYLLYLCLITVFGAVIIMIGYVDKAGLFCNSIDLLESIKSPTAYCSITGIVYYYVLMQSTLWVFFHVAALFWGIAFPFHYRRIKANGYIKYIHVATVAVAILVPLVSALAPLKDGYFPPRFPPIICLAADPDYTFYILLFPISILLAVSTCLLIITFWIILKEFVIKKISRGKKASRVGKAQVKIMFVFFYYILLGGLALAIFGYYIGASNELVADQEMVFLCESLGRGSGRNCKEMRSGLLTNVRNLSLAAIVMQGLITLVVLIFIVDCKSYKCKKHKKSVELGGVKIETNNLSITNPMSTTIDSCRRLQV